MPKKSTPKKASAPTKTPAPKKAAPKKAAPKKPPPKKASAPNKEITSNIEASASHLPPVSKKTFTAKKNVEADIEDFDHDVLSPDDRDILTLGISDYNICILTLGHNVHCNALLCLVTTKDLYSILNTN